MGKAYLTYSGAGANGFFGFGETTSINEELRMKNEEFATAPVYDLQGRRVDANGMNTGLQEEEVEEGFAPFFNGLEL